MFSADETKVGALLPDMDRLLRKLMKFVTLRLLRGQTDLCEVKFKQAKFIWYATVSCADIIVPLNLITLLLFLW